MKSFTGKALVKVRFKTLAGRVEEGSLYPALQRILIKRWVIAEGKQSQNNRRAPAPKGCRDLSDLAARPEFGNVATEGGEP